MKFVDDDDDTSLKQSTQNSATVGHVMYFGQFKRLLNTFLFV